jgi:acetolactate synthase-1/2/3 large subunit
MNHAFVGRVLSEAMDPDAAVFSELGVIGPAMSLPKPGGFFWTPLAGGLGWGVPAALGAKLADRNRQVIATVGDGSYIFANPAACHQVAATHDLPILTIVMNNGIWNAVKRATTGMYPKGRAVQANEMPLTSLGPSPDYCAMARAHGAHAEKVEDPAALRAALEAALAETRGGRQALLEVVVR